jgi:hypothetical protein
LETVDTGWGMPPARKGIDTRRYHKSWLSLTYTNF